MTASLDHGQENLFLIFFELGVPVDPRKRKVFFSSTAGTC